MRFHAHGRMLDRRRSVATSGGNKGVAWRRRRSSTSLEVRELESRELLSLSIQIDYSYDNDKFFNTQAKKDLMQLAANTLAADLNDSLTAITPSGTNTWSATFPDPSTGTIRSLSNLVVPANTLIIYVGGGSLAGGSEAGLGSTGGFGASGDSNWLNIVSTRGQAGAVAKPATDYGPWGGEITFDDSGSTNWYFNQSLPGIGLNQTDFLSVAEHELGHVLGLGTADSWRTYVSKGKFVGPASEAVYGGPVPLNPNSDHWADGTKSDGRNALMDPVLTDGTRVSPTSLDLAALKDIGWQVSTASLVPVVQFSSPNYTATEGGPAATITVTRSGGSGAFAVNYGTTNGTATAGLDYQTTLGTLNFGAGETSKTFTIPIIYDPAKDGPETVNVALGATSAGALLGSPSNAVLTINDAPASAHGQPADFDPDGRSDLGVFRPGNAQWLIYRSSGGPITPAPTFGATSFADIPVVGDFDGIGRSEVGVFRPSTGQWFVLGPNGGHLVGTFGATKLMDIPVPGDYDGVGHTELAVYRPSTAQWFVLGPQGGHLLGTFGAPNLQDIPAPGDYDGVGHTEMAVYRPATSQWFVLGPSGGRLLGTFGAPNFYDIPAPGNYDGVGHTEMAVYRPATGQWFVLGPTGAHLEGDYGDYHYSDVPIEASAGSLVKLGLTGKLKAQSITHASAVAPSAASTSAPVVVQSGVAVTSGARISTLSASPRHASPVVAGRTRVASTTPSLSRNGRPLGNESVVF